MQRFCTAEGLAFCPLLFGRQKARPRCFLDPAAFLVVLVDDLIRLPLFELVAPGPAEMDAAYAAFVAFGKGSGHPAGLNFGDVFSYALAKVRGLPLLYKGEEFSQTDIASAVNVMRAISPNIPHR